MAFQFGSGMQAKASDANSNNLAIWIEGRGGFAAADSTLAAYGLEMGVSAFSPNMIIQSAHVNFICLFVCVAAGRTSWYFRSSTQKTFVMLISAAYSSSKLTHRQLNMYLLLAPG